MKKILIVLEGICSIGLLSVYAILWSIHNTISYENASIYEKTLKSNLFIIMEHNHILGCLSVIFGVVLAIVAIIDMFNRGVFKNEH